MLKEWMIIILWEGRIFILLYFTDYKKGISFLETKNISITNGPVLKEFFYLQFHLLAKRHVEFYGLPL